MLARLSIKAKLYSIAALAVAIIIAMALVSVTAAKNGVHALAEVYEQNVQSLARLQQIDVTLKEVRFRIAGVLLDQMPVQGSRNQLSDARKTLPELWTQFKELMSNVQLQDKDKELIEKIEKQISKTPAFFEKLDAAYAANDKKVLGGLLEDEWPAIQGNLIKPIGQLVPLQEAAAKSTYERNIKSGNQLNSIAIVVAVSSAFLFLGFVLWINRGIAKGIGALKETMAAMAHGDLSQTFEVTQHDEIGTMGESLNQSIQQIRTIIRSTKEVADNLATISNQVAAVSEMILSRGGQRNTRIISISAAMEEMRASVASISNGAGEVASASELTRTVANEGHDAMVRNVESVAAMLQSVENSRTVIGDLSESVKRISEIAKVIDDIAGQTNLLALNAAIEAARAGEQGRGFAVVADEVRKLAERTGASTKDIANMVTTISQNTVTAVRSMEDVKTQVAENASLGESTKSILDNIVSAANKVTDLASHIAQATSEQLTVTSDTAKGMEEISMLTQSNQVNVREMAQAATQLRDNSSELQRLVGQFRISA